MKKYEYRKFWITPKSNESYNEYIERIKNSRENKRPKGVYMEEHHIHPRSVGGSDDKDNLIYLYAYEHYYAHKLLALENSTNIKLVRAWWLLSHMQTQYSDWVGVSAEEYEEARIAFAARLSEAEKGKPLSENCYAAHAKFLEGVKLPVRCVETGIQYPSISEAGEATGIHQGNIRHAAYGDRQTAGNYHWEFIDETMKAQAIENRKSYDKTKQYRPIICVETNEIFDSIYSAANGIKNNIKLISAVCHGKRLTTNGYHYELLFLTEEEKLIIANNKKQLENYKNNKPNSTPIQCVETGIVYKNQAEACNILNIKNQNLSAVFVGKQQTAGGYHWIRITKEEYNQLIS